MRRLVLAILGFVLCGFAPAQAQAPTAPTYGPEQVKAIEAIVRDYIVNHPEVLIEAMQNLESRQRENAAADAKQGIAQRKAELYDDASAPVAGNPKGDVTLVEFFDYRCPYCKQVKEPLEALLKADPKLKLVYKEFPILGPDSLVASRAALAARMQNKYLALHDALMKARGSLDEATVLRLAGSVGLDVERLKRDMESEEIARAIERNHALAEALKITGTPAFVIGERVIPGAVDVATLKRLVAEAREKN